MALSYQQLKIAIPLVIKAGNVPSLVGEAGIGKSALIQDVATTMGAKLFTTVVSLSEKGDLAIPIPPLTDQSFVKTDHYGTLANVQYGYAETLVAIIKAAETNPAQPIIWFLDEFNRGSQAVQSELMNLVLQRQINALKLPEQVHIVIAQNPDRTMANFANSDYAVTAGDAAIRDRTVRLIMQVSTTDWLLWAKQVKIHPLVTQYIETHPQLLAPTEHEADLYPTPRAWARVSANLYQLEQLDATIQQALATDLFSGDLGFEVGMAFAKFVAENGHQLTLAEFIEQANQPLVIDEIKGLTLMRQWIQSLATYPIDEFVTQFSHGLDALSPDGQFAIVQQLGEQPALVDQLTKLYQSAQLNAEAAKLYQRLTTIALEAGD